MKHIQQKFKLIILAAMVLSWVTIAYGFSSGPPPANTGAPGESTCNSCHGGTLNSGGGSVTITGLPATYTPGTRYDVTVTVSQTGRSRWGFECTSLAADGSFAGTFTLTEPLRTQSFQASVAGKVRTYVLHTASGTQTGTQNTARFNFAWTAPAATVGTVTFYAAGNAANGNGGDSGDNIYTTSVRVNAPAAAQPPTIASLNPTNGTVDGGTTVTITGTNFANGITTTFNGKNAQTTFVDNRTIRVTTPANPAGAVDVVVRNSDGLSATSRGAFTYEAAALPAPTLATISPTNGPATGGTDVTITGANFAQGATVQIGAGQATVTSVSGTEIKAKTPLNPSGAVDVIVKNPDGQQAVLKGAFTFEGTTPNVAAQILSPNGGEVLSAGGLAFNITWTVRASAAATQTLEASTDGGLNFNTSIATGLPATATAFSYSVPAGVASDRGRVRIRVTDGSTTVSDVSDADFRILAAPTISSLSPNSTGANSQIKKLKINGANFVDGLTVELNGTAVSGAKLKSATSIQVKKVNIGAAGTYKVRVKNPNGATSREADLVVQ